MRPWLALPFLALLLPTAHALQLEAPDPSGAVALGPCLTPYVGPDETHGNALGSDEGFFVMVLPTGGEDRDGDGNAEGYGLGMTSCNPEAAGADAAEPESAEA